MSSFDVTGAVIQVMPSMIWGSLLESTIKL